MKTLKIYFLISLCLCYFHVCTAQCPVINGLSINLIQNQGNGNCVYQVAFTFSSSANNKSLRVIASCNGTQVLSQCITVNAGNNQNGTSSNFTCACSSTKTVSITTYNNNGCGNGGACITTTLPIKFVGIKVIEKQNKPYLSWEVQEQSSTLKYEIERSYDGILFTKIVDTLANSNANNYHFFDAMQFKECYYRVKAIDVNGDFKYSEIVKYSVTNGQKLFLSPTIANNYIKIVGISSSTAMPYSIISLDGKIIEADVLQNNVIFTQKLASGFYILQLKVNNDVKSLRFFKL
jgi:hypothetical protein